MAEVGVLFEFLYKTFKIGNLKLSQSPKGLDCYDVRKLRKEATFHVPP